jgi:hypothetical protein
MTVATTNSAGGIQSSEVVDDTYEAMDINATQGAGEGNKLVYTYVAVPADSVATTTTQCSTVQVTTTEQLGGDDTYEVPDHEIVGSPPLPPPPATGLAVPGRGGGGGGGYPYHGGVRESVYDEPDNPGVAQAATQPQPTRVKFQLTECMAYAETN